MDLRACTRTPMNWRAFGTGLRLQATYTPYEEGGIFGFFALLKLAGVSTMTPLR